MIDRNKAEKALRTHCSDPGLQRIGRALGGFEEVYLVGGAVRDALTGLVSKDFDLAANMPAAGIAAKLEAADIKVVPTGLRHDTVLALPFGKEPGIEITSFRVPSDHANTEPPQSALQQDLCGRDFTINAIAFSIQNGSLIDPLGGIGDIEHKRIAAVGRAEARFTEDPLRIVRMVRFACTLGFDVEEESYQAALRLAPTLSSISRERIRDEFNLILLSKQPARGLRMLLNLGILAQFMPELVRGDGFEQNEYHKADVFSHTLEVVERLPEDLILRLAALFHDISKPQCLSVDESGFRHFYKHECVGADAAAEIMQNLRYSNSDIEGVSQLVKTHMRPLDVKAPGIRRLLRDTGDHYWRWRALKEADSLACRFDPDEVSSQLRDFDSLVDDVKSQPDVSPLKNLAVNGQDLLSLGFEEGPEIGRVLRLLHEHVLDFPEDNDSRTLLAMAKQEL